MKWQFSRPIAIAKQITAPLMIACTLAASVGTSVAQQLPSLPSVTVGTASLISPADANSYYQRQGLSSPAQRPADAEIAALARNLGHDPAKIYWWVKDNVKLTPTFGVSKGARGAAIDLAGTPFDQAELLVKLLRASGFTAQYRFGTITVSGSQFNNWFGITNPDVASQVLSAGGIPAQITANGSAISSVSMLHIWVTFVVNGVTYKVDPSFKTSITTAPVMSIAGAAGLNSNTLISGALSGAESSTNGGVAKVRHMNVANVWSALQASSVSLLNALKSNYPSASMDDIIGTTKIVPAGMCSAGGDCPLGVIALGNSEQSLPYTEVSSVTFANEIPNSLRTTMRLYIDDTDLTLYADEIYAKSLSLQHTQTMVPHGWRVLLDGQLMSEGTTAGSDANGMSQLNVQINHPYAAENGTYMDETITQATYGEDVPVVVQLGLGDVSANYRQRLSQRTAGAKATTVQPVCAPTEDNDAGRGNGCELTGSFDYALSARTLLAASWLVQFNRVAEISGQLNSTLSQHHHSVVIVSLVLQWSGQAGGGIIANSQKINISTALSVESRQGDATIRSTELATLTSLASTLEGSVVEQSQQSVYPSSVAAKLDWLQRASVPAGSDWIEFATPSNWATAKSNLLADWYAGWQSSPGATTASPTTPGLALVSAQAEAYINAGYSLVIPISSFLGPGYVFDRVSHKEVCGTSGGRPIYCLDRYTPQLDRGGALIGYTADNSHIAYAVVRGDQTYKGGGGTVVSNPDEQFKPEANANDKNGGPHAVTHNVDLRNGTLSLSMTPDLVTGNGSAPASLSFQRTFRAGFSGGWTTNWDSGASISGDGMAAMGGAGPQSAAELIVAIMALNGLAPNTQTTDIDKLTHHVVASLVNMWLAEQIASNTVEITMGASQKAFTHLADGSFQAPTGDSSRLVANVTRQFGGGGEGAALGPGWYTLPASKPTMLTALGFPTAAGSRLPTKACSDYGDPSLFPLNLIESDGTTASFSFFCVTRMSNFPSVQIGGRASFHIARQGWHLTQLTYPAGVSVNLSYNTPTYDGYTDISEPSYWPLLQSVTNSFGRQLNFSYGTLGSASNALTVTDNSDPAHPRSVSFDGLYCPNVPYPPDGGSYLEPCETILTAARDPLGNTTTYDYIRQWPGGQATNAIPNQGQFSQWIGDGLPWVVPAQLAAIHLPGSTVTNDFAFTYDEFGRVQSVTDANGHTTSYLTANGRRGEIVDAMTASVTSIFDEFTNEIRSIDQIGRVTEKAYDGVNRQIRLTQPQRNYTQTDYDVRSNVIQTRVYPKPGSSLAPLVSSVVYSEGPAVWTCTTQVTCNKPSSSTSARGGTSNYTWNSYGQLTQVLLPSDKNNNRSQTNFGYTQFNGMSLLTSKTVYPQSGRSVVSIFDYDSSNHFVPQALTVDFGTSKLNLKTSFAFNARGDFIHLDGPRKNAGEAVDDSADYIWDDDQRLVLAITSDPDGSGPNARMATKYTYNAEGLITKTEKGNTTSVDASDFSPYLTVIIDHDAAGNKVRERHYGGTDLNTILTLTDFSYDADDRLLCTAVRMNRDVYGSLPTYLLNTQALPDACAIGAAGSFGQDRITKTIFDAAGQTRQVLRGFNSPIQQTYASYKYSLNGKQVAVADADANIAVGVANAEALNENAPTNHQTNYSFDDFDRPAITQFADASYEQFVYYDTNYNPCSSDDKPCTRRNRSGQITTFTYDLLDRMILKAVPQTTAVPADTVSWDYDLTGNVLTLSDTQGHTLTNAYDNAGRLSTATRTVPGLTGSQTISYQYDAAGNRIRLTWPDTYYVTYGFDALNRMNAVTDKNGASLATFGYDQGGRRALTQYADTGAKVSYTWSPEDELLSQTHATLNQPHYIDYTDGYSPAHQIVSSVVSNPDYQFVPQAVGTDSYVTNGLNQYASVSASGTANPIYYDKNGNLVCAGPGCTSHDPPGAGAWFDAAPPVGTSQYLYDPENRLVQTRVGSALTSYVYDPQGRRVKKSTGGVDTYFLDAGDDEIAEYQADGSGNPVLKNRFVQGPSVDQPIAMIAASGTITFFHQDKLGSVVAMSNAAGNVVEGPFTYDAYGQCFAGGQPCSTGVPYRFTGRRLDPETGLYYYRARYYSAALGRFLQTDPIGYKDNINWYAYVKNDPTDNTDPTGLVCADPCVLPPTFAKNTGDMLSTVGQAAVEHPGETLQIVGAAAQLVPVAPVKAGGVVASGAGKVIKAVDGETTTTLKPGPFAGGSVPASGPKVTKTEQSQVNEIGNDTGCHTCGTKTPGTQSGNWVGDHQPPTKLNPEGAPQRLYPQCLACSRRQGGEVNKARRGIEDMQ